MCHCEKVHSVAWNCTGTKLASGSVDQTARVWHIEPHGHVQRLEFDVISIWVLQGGNCAQLAELSGENINITYKPDGTHIAVGNRDDELTILDVRKFKPIHKRKFNYEVNEIPWSTSSEIFFLTTGNVTRRLLLALPYTLLNALYTMRDFIVLAMSNSNCFKLMDHAIYFNEA
ncbi:hypothetical protein GBA52_021600 [Prunus armeniaca]|nr:hypothetical protein GBA52_021600 [Prunus armeniaca]